MELIRKLEKTETDTIPETFKNRIIPPVLAILHVYKE